MKLKMIHGQPSIKKDLVSAEKFSLKRDAVESSCNLQTHAACSSSQEMITDT
jgi:hypothetical protein